MLNNKKKTNREATMSELENSELENSEQVDTDLTSSDSLNDEHDSTKQQLAQLKRMRSIIENECFMLDIEPEFVSNISLKLFTIHGLFFTKENP